MNPRPLGSSGLDVAPVGFGCWQLGGDGWGTLSARAVQTAILRAIDLGLNVFDTAPIYGFGQSEDLLGRTLSGRSERVVVVSKVGLVWDHRKVVRHNHRPESLRAQLEGSLQRLRREPLDLLLLHWPDPAVLLDDSVAVLDSLRSQGKIRAWGLSNFPAADVIRIRRPDVVLEYPSNALKLYAQESRAAAVAGEELLGALDSTAPGFIAYDVLARGLLGGRYTEAKRFGKRDLRTRDDRFSATEFPGNLQRARRISELARRLGTPPAALAIRAVLERAGVACALVGFKTSTQVEEAAEAVNIQMTEATRATMKAIENNEAINSV